MSSQRKKRFQLFCIHFGHYQVLNDIIYSAAHRFDSLAPVNPIPMSSNLFNTSTWRRKVSSFLKNSVDLSSTFYDSNFVPLRYL